MRRPLRLVTALVSVLFLTACSDVREATTATTPPAATAEEIRVFCEAWSEVSADGGLVLPESLIDVAPAEIKDVIIHMTTPPGEGWFEDLERLNEFVKHCET